MDRLARLAIRPVFMWYFGIVGDILLVVGIVTAAMDLTVAGFTPMLWFLLGIACYLGMIWVVVLRILARMESQ